MKANKLEDLIAESIRLEQNAAALYEIFAQSHPEDQEFWWDLHLEEKSHANLIRAAKDSFSKRGKFPFDLVANSIEDLKQANARLKGLVEQCVATPPSRRQACELAIALENESGETHFGVFMEKEATTPVEIVFQKLNREDKNHMERIQGYLESLPADAE